MSKSESAQRGDCPRAWERPSRTTSDAANRAQILRRATSPAVRGFAPEKPRKTRRTCTVSDVCGRTERRAADNASRGVPCTLLAVRKQWKRATKTYKGTGTGEASLRAANFPFGSSQLR
ncbi:unnamed protein product, partial [Iphiclides podalirius]